jgi:hypothetical protein
MTEEVSDVLEVLSSECSEVFIGKSPGPVNAPFRDINSHGMQSQRRGRAYLADSDSCACSASSGLVSTSTSVGFGMGASCL